MSPRNRNQLDIIIEMTYLKSLSLDILKPSLDRQIIEYLPRLRNLQDLHLNGLNRFTTDDFHERLFLFAQNGLSKTNTDTYKNF